MELRNELKRFLESLDGDELRNLADGNLREDMVVDEYLASLSSDAKDEKPKDWKCHCGEASTGWTQIKACNICGMEVDAKDEGEGSKEPCPHIGHSLMHCHIYNKQHTCKGCSYTRTPPPSLSAEEMLKSKGIKDTLFSDGVWVKGALSNLMEEYRTAGDKPKEDLTVADELEKDNPYPETVFLPMSETEITEVAEYLKKGGYSIDCLAGNTMRRSWNLCVGRLRELIKER